MFQIGNTIKQIRLSKGVSQKQLAILTGLTPSYLSLLERDRREPSLAVVRRLATALEVPEEILIWDAIVLPSDLSKDDRKICEMAKELVRRYLGGTERASLAKEQRKGRQRRGAK